MSTQPNLPTDEPLEPDFYGPFIEIGEITNPPEADVEVRAEIIDDSRLRVGEKSVKINDDGRFVLNALFNYVAAGKEVSVPAELQHPTPNNTFRPKMVDKKRSQVFSNTMSKLRKDLVDPDSDAPIIIREGKINHPQYSLNPGLHITDKRGQEESTETVHDPKKIRTTGNREELVRNMDSLRYIGLTPLRQVFPDPEEGPLEIPISEVKSKLPDSYTFTMQFGRERVAKELSAKQLAGKSKEVRAILAYSDAIKQGVPHNQLVEHLNGMLKNTAGSKRALDITEVIKLHNACISRRYIKIDDDSDQIKLLSAAKQKLIEEAVITPDELEGTRPAPQDIAPAKKPKSHAVHNLAVLLAEATALSAELGEDASKFVFFAKKYGETGFAAYSLSSLEQLVAALSSKVGELQRKKIKLQLNELDS